MDYKYEASPAVVKKFLKDIKEIISSASFNPNRDFFMQKRENDLSTSLYTNYNSMMILGYTTVDVINEIKSLTSDHYCETVIDTISTNVNLHVFKKKIKGEIVYIKITIRNNSKILCISFHISKEKNWYAL